MVLCCTLSVSQQGTGRVNEFGVLGLLVRRGGGPAPSSQESGSATAHSPLRSQPRSGAGVERALVWTRLAGAVRDPPSTVREKRGGELLERERIADGG